MTLCGTQGVAHARSTEKDMETEDKGSKGGDGEGASEETNSRAGGDADLLAVFSQYRGLLFSVAYRMRTGSR